MACIGSKCSEVCGELARVARRYVRTANRFTIYPSFRKPSCVRPAVSPTLPQIWSLQNGHLPVYWRPIKLRQLHQIGRCSHSMTY